MFGLKKRGETSTRLQGTVGSRLCIGINAPVKTWYGYGDPRQHPTFRRKVISKMVDDEPILNLKIPYYISKEVSLKIFRFI